jgi:hypothetical protein
VSRKPLSRDEVVTRLRNLHVKSQRAIDLLEQDNLSAEAEAELRKLIPQLKAEISSEYKRMSPVAIQESMAPEESFFYRPAINEAWADTGLSGLRVEGRPKTHWYPILEAVNTKLHYYLHQLESST